MENETMDTRNTVMPSGLILTQEHIRRSFCKRRMESYRLHPDVVESVKAWFQKIESK